MSSSEQDRKPDPERNGGRKQAAVIPGPCVEFRDRVEELIDGVLAPEEGERLRAHASVCSGCASEERAAAQFRALLLGDGSAALDQVVSRALTERAVRNAEHEDQAAAVASEPVAEPAARAPRGRIIQLRWAVAGAAAASLLAAVAAYSLRPAAAPGLPTLDVAGHSADGRAASIPAGSVAALDGGGGLRVTSGATITLIDGVDGVDRLEGEHLRLESGAAAFWSGPERPLGVETPHGVVEGTDAMFHVALAEDGSLAVQIAAGQVSFRDADGRLRPALVAGERFEIGPSGDSRVISGARQEEAEFAAELAAIEVAGLRHDTARLQEEVAGLRLERGEQGPPPVAPTVSTEALDQVPWDEMGAAAADLLLNMQRDGDAAVRHNAAGVFFRQVDRIKQATGVSNPFEGLLHPGAIARLAPGFIEALAPDADAASRRDAITRIQAAAEASSERLSDGLVPADVIVARLDLWREVVVVVRECLGDEAAARVAGGFRGVRDIAAISPSPIETFVDDAAASFGKEFDLTDEQRAQFKTLIEDYVEATVEVQDRIEAEYGPDVARRLLVRPPPPTYTTVDDDIDETAPGDVVDQALIAIEVKRALAGPRAELERQAFDVLRADQRARGFKRGWGLKSFVEQRKRRNREREEEE